MVNYELNRHPITQFQTRSDSRLVVVRIYVQQKTCIKYLVVVWLRLLFKIYFYLKIHQNNFFYFKKIIFDINASKWSENKKILIWSKKNNFFQKRFWNAKTNRVLRNSVIKACKNCFLKTMFQIQFFNGSHNKKTQFNIL